jgi:DME family drug/metabolite transporter
VLLAALSWSTNGLAMAALPAGYGPVTFAAVRLLAGGALTLLCGMIIRSWSRRRLRNRMHVGRLAAAAAAMAVYQALYFMALHLAGVAVGTVVQMASVPMFVGLFTIVTARRWPTRAWAAATAVAVAGGSVLMVAGGGCRGASATGVLCALGAGCVYACFTMICAGGMSRGDDCSATMGTALFGAGLLLSPALLLGPTGWLGTGAGLAAAAYVAVVPTALAYALYGRGLRGVSAPTASTLTMAEPASAVVIGVVLLHERVDGLAYLGLAMIVLALLWLSVPSADRGT